MLLRFIWSRTFWQALAKRRVNVVEPTPIHRITTAIATSIHCSRGEASGSPRFFSDVTSPKNTRWYDHSRYTAEKITPAAANLAHCQCCSNVPSKMRHSPTKPCSIARPREGTTRDEHSP